MEYGRVETREDEDGLFMVLVYGGEVVGSVYRLSGFESYWAENYVISCLLVEGLKKGVPIDPEDLEEYGIDPSAEVIIL